MVFCDGDVVICLDDVLVQLHDTMIVQESFVKVVDQFCRSGYWFNRVEIDAGGIKRSRFGVLETNECLATRSIRIL